MKISRLMTTLCCENLSDSKQFYCQLFDFTAAYDSDWFVQLISSDSALELGLIAKDHDVVPDEVASEAGGMYLTFVVEDADAFYKRALSQNIDIVSPLEDTFYGQRRLLIQAPEGTICDVSSPTV